MDWRKYIYSNPNILLGKPVVKGTRLSVEFILELFAAGWTESQVLESYPTLNIESIRAAFAFSVECMQNEFQKASRPLASRIELRDAQPLQKDSSLETLQSLRHEARY
ncbi:MAG: DUF433 domain-containing protein [Cyanobacteria bacterium P01_F01_bin.143]